MANMVLHLHYSLKSSLEGNKKNVITIDYRSFDLSNTGVTNSFNCCVALIAKVAVSVIGTTCVLFLPWQVKLSFAIWFNLEQ